MSNQTEIERLGGARNKIRNKLVGMGLAASTDKLDALAENLDAMPYKNMWSALLSPNTPGVVIPKGYHNGMGLVRVDATENTSVTPTKDEQVISNDIAFMKQVTVAPIPDKYQDVSEVDATAQQVLEGFTIVDAEGNVVEGTMTDHGDLGGNVTIDAENYYYDIPEGYHNGGGSVSVMLEEKTVTPTDTQQIITPSEGCVLSKVTVEAAESGGGGVETYTGTVYEQLASPFGMAFTICYTNGSGEYISQSISGSTPVSITVAKNTIVFCYNENSIPEIVGAEIIFSEGHYRVILPIQDGFSIKQN